MMLFSIVSRPASSVGAVRGMDYNSQGAPRAASAGGRGPSPNANEKRGRGRRLRGRALVAHFPSRGEGGTRWEEHRPLPLSRAPPPSLRERRLLGVSGARL